MKKIINILLVLTLLALLAVPAMAFSGSVSLSSSSTNVHRGDTFTITAYLNTSDAIRLGTVKLTYDTNALELVGGSCLVSNTTLGQVVPAQNVGTFMIGSATNVSGQIFTFQFRVKDTAGLNQSYSISSTASIGIDTGEGISSGSCSITVVCNHNYGSSKKVDNNSHQSTCSICGDVKTSDHTWNAGNITKQANCKETGIREKTCTACDATKEETIDKTDHTYSTPTSVNSSTHKRVCSVCKYESVSYHSYSGWRHDQDVHYRLCACGYKADKAAHTSGPEATETTDQLCTVCSRVLKPKFTHKHNFFPDWESDSVNHWHNCSNCDERDSEEAHVFEDDCDATCDTCEYTREPAHAPAPEWTTDETGHWRVCTACGEELEFAAHTPGPEATITAPQNCTLCGFEITPILPHEHTYDPDDNTHRHKCDCGHIYEADAKDCTVCGSRSFFSSLSFPFTIPWWTVCIAEAVIFLIILLIVARKKRDEDII